jgi:phosphonate degradation associated HDIG domain protein
MPRLLRLKELEELYATRGGLSYGEGVTQLEHALQCACLAEASGAAPSLVAAALLHDVGHLVGREEDAAIRDDRHEVIGSRLLANLFGAAVYEPIALHVAAKRYLCFQEPGYFNALSPASQHSLALQGGPFDAAEAAAFERLPHSREAVNLRQLDDSGKRNDVSARSFADFAPVLRNLLIGGAAG